MFIFRSPPENSHLLRAYTFKHCYDEARFIEKSKNQNPQEMMSNCLIIRPHRIKNETDFGYKEELKTNILKKIHFVYLETVTDLISFLWIHLSKPLHFGMLFIENVDLYFGGKIVIRKITLNTGNAVKAFWSLLSYSNSCQANWKTKGGFAFLIFAVPKSSRRKPLRRLPRMKILSTGKF